MQNKIIVENLNQILIKNNFTVYLPSKLPSNDGSISVGQVMIANSKYQKVWCFYLGIVNIYCYSLKNLRKEK